MSQLGLATAVRDRGMAATYAPSKVIQFKGWLSAGEGTVNGAQTSVDDRNEYGALIQVNPYDNLSFKVVGHEFTSDSALYREGSAFGGGYTYKIGNFTSMGEMGLFDYDQVGVNNEMTIYYAQLGYKVPKTDFQFVGRYDFRNAKTFNAATGVKLTDADSKIKTVGVNWDFDKNARVQLEHNFKSANGAEDDTTVQLGVKF